MIYSQDSNQLKLSLHICCKLIESLRGQIRVNSILGKGSVFSFTIPCQFPEYYPEMHHISPEFTSRDNAQRIIQNQLPQPDLNSPRFLPGESRSQESNMRPPFEVIDTDANPLSEVRNGNEGLSVETLQALNEGLRPIMTARSDSNYMQAI